MRTIAFHNLGCKVNSYELEVMRQIAQKRGYEIVQFEQKADVYVVNTCTVTNIADRKSRQMLHRAKHTNPEALVVAVGCYVQTGAEKLLQDACVDLAIGNNHKTEIIDRIEEALAAREAEQQPERHAAPRMIREDLAGPGVYEPMCMEHSPEHTRATIKIQDGCNQFCSYCAIPLARGRVRSREAREVLREVAHLTEQGCREVVLTGIHIGSYEAPDTGEDLVSLIEGICAVPGVSRVRMGSVEPRLMTRENAQRLAKLPALCPHFHLSLQSGCDATLRRMNRHYTAKEYADSVSFLREAFDTPAVTTDVIVGFPGETQEEFEETRRFLERLRLYDMHIFQYSRREGTRAASMPDQVPEEEKKRRSEILLDLAKRCSEEFRAAMVGQDREALLEETETIGGEACLVGHTRDYVKVAVPVTEGFAPGDAAMVRIVAAKEGVIYGKRK